MDSSKTPTPAEEQDAEALETPEDGGSLETNSQDQTIDTTADSGGAKPAAATPPPKGGGFKGFLRKFNLYLLLFVFILVVAGVIVMIAYLQSKNATTSSTIKTQDLTQSALEQVANSDANVGSTQQILNVQSSAVFAGKVLVRQDLEVAGSLQIGGTVGLTNLTVAGSTQLGEAQINKNLSVAGDTALQGATTIAKGLQVNGSSTFSGPISAPQVTTSNLQLNSDLTLTHHVLVGGGTPGRSGGSALGGGGSASVSGSDTAGTASINTGSSPAAGCFITINFTQRYNSTPRILLTPVGSQGGSIDYYVTRTTTSFSICDAGTPPSGASFAFDYFVLG